MVYGLEFLLSYGGTEATQKGRFDSEFTYFPRISFTRSHKSSRRRNYSEENLPNRAETAKDSRQRPPPKPPHTAHPAPPHREVVRSTVRHTSRLRAPGSLHHAITTLCLDSGLSFRVRLLGCGGSGERAVQLDGVAERDADRRELLPGEVDEQVGRDLRVLEPPDVLGGERAEPLEDLARGVRGVRGGGCVVMRRSGRGSAGRLRVWCSAPEVMPTRARLSLSAPRCVVRRAKRERSARRARTNDAHARKHPPPRPGGFRSC